MDNSYRFGQIEVTCEGYSYPDDPYVLKGSCGVNIADQSNLHETWSTLVDRSVLSQLEYTIDYVQTRNEEQYFGGQHEYARESNYNKFVLSENI